MATPGSAAQAARQPREASRHAARLRAASGRGALRELPASSPTGTPKQWDLRRLYALAGCMCCVVTAAQLLFLGIGFAAMRPAAQQPDRLNLFWYFGLRAPLQFSEMETMMYISLSWAAQPVRGTLLAAPQPGSPASSDGSAWCWAAPRTQERSLAP